MTPVTRLSLDGSQWTAAREMKRKEIRLLSTPIESVEIHTGDSIGINCCSPSLTRIIRIRTQSLNGTNELPACPSLRRVRNED